MVGFKVASQASLVVVVLYGFLVVSKEYFSAYIEGSDWADFAARTQLKVHSSTGMLARPGDSRSNITERQQQRKAKFYILPMPEITTWLLENYTDQAFQYYDKSLNEEQAEVWLHRGLERLSSRTYNASEADVVIIPGYLHFNANLVKNKKDKQMPFATDEWIQLLSERLIPNKVHVVATPTWNPSVGNGIGLPKLMQALQSHDISAASFGFERNKFWQKIDPKRIIPVPYVVTPVLPRKELEEKVLSTNRTKDFAFYAGLSRGHAVEWGGCDRSKMLSPLQNRKDMDVRIVSKNNRLSQEEYNRRMFTSEYCLILCGDTPSSRSLASSMLYGCIPIRVGSRLRGFCEPPCHVGWGWTSPNLTHMPFDDKIDWDSFPEVNEALFSENPGSVLEELFNKTDSTKKDKFRDTMRRTQMAWTYGWGSPVNSTLFGDAAEYAWESLVAYLVRIGRIADSK